MRNEPAYQTFMKNGQLFVICCLDEEKKSQTSRAETARISEKQINRRPIWLFAAALDHGAN